MATHPMNPSEPGRHAETGDQRGDQRGDQPADLGSGSELRSLLILRAAEDRCTEQDWTRLEAMAKAEPGLWHEVVLTRRDAAALEQSVREQIESAMHVDIPAEEHMVLRLTQRSRAVATWAGWAAAAVIGLAWLGVPMAAPQSGTRGGPSGQAPQSAGLFSSASQALDEYLKRGKADGNVVQQIPTKVLLDAKPSADGNGYDVLYMRQILERAKVPDLYKLSTDEWGEPAHAGDKIRWPLAEGGSTAY